MTRPRTPPRGYPAQSWDDVTQPGMNEFELTEMRRRRSEKISKAHELALTAVRDNEELRRRIGNVEVKQESIIRNVTQIKEGQIGLAHVADQIFTEVKKRNETEKDARRSAVSEGGAWKRQIVQSVLAIATLAVAITTLAINKC